MVAYKKTCKQAQEVIFSRELNKSSHPILFNNTPVFSSSWQKHLGMCLNETLNLNFHIKEKMSNAMKCIDIIKKLIKTLILYTPVV